MPEWQKKLLVTLMVFGVGGMAYFITSYKLRMDARLEARLAAARNPCKIRVFQHNGQDVVETIQGVMIKAYYGEYWYCRDGKAIESYPLFFPVVVQKEEGQDPKKDKIFIKSIAAKSYENPSQYFYNHQKKFNEVWRWRPRIPHPQYPLDLYPNFGRESQDGPDPQAGKGIVRGAVFWGVRGAKHPRWGTPDIFKCWFELPEGRSPQEENYYAVNIEWLLGAKISEKIGAEGCQGVVSDKRTGNITAELWLKGRHIHHIDQIIEQVSDFLETLMVERE
ncbi:hypothetical protein [Vandammella animalimorsus]|uniref:hypothetical protein n=1 Tax=Vandammella animalimorsus TaxID=2029117 RepID=UPI0011C35207|nr:hypothetical protein [Vandammella animalimorsus]